MDDWLDDDDSLTTVESSRRAGTGEDPRDDWLGGGSDLDWFDDGAAPRDGGSRRGGFGPNRVGGRYELDPEIRRRRFIAAGVLVAIVILAVVFALIAFGGGGGGGNANPGITTPINTVPATTTPTKPSTTSTTKSKSSPSKVTLPASGRIMLGDTGASVKTLQKALIKLGSTSLVADGNFGSITQQAVMTFQQQHGLTADGVVGAKTAKAINTALASAS